ncbi:FAD-dependent oxidoreductase [Thalassoroseus pseudoceratinae]|uniref:FAD-dependent oxidoreductase n=1 Tax=Thalassoroseus pseudoceratinae TaxID=2713176 RepID=UPI00142467E6|nr:FAD-dependent oxidoreductase [Thalassoroseus pseudoceratinae]
MKIVIIGAVAGGASAAARARRLDEDAEIVLIERGTEPSFANCGLPYYVGGEIESRDKLLVAPAERLRQRYQLDVRTRQEVTSIDRDNQVVDVRNLVTGETYTESYDRLIISTGASPFRPPIPGIEGPHVLELRDLADADRMFDRVTTGGSRRAVIVGAGFIGIEVAENLVRRGLDVTVVELAEQILPPWDREIVRPLEDHIRQQGVTLKLNDSAAAFEETGTGDANLIVKLESGEELPACFAVVCIGVRPESRLANEAGINVGQRGGIITNEHMQTSDPNVYAVGDVAQVKDFVTGEPTQIPLAGPANRQGRIAADHIFGRNSVYRGTQGTAIVGVFGKTAAMTGQSEKLLQRANRPYEKIYIHPNDHAGYYPGASSMTLKLLFNPDDARIWGAQAVGAAGVDKRIDVIAMAIHAGMTVYDLEEVELCYAPQYGSAKDPVNMAGFVAAGILRGDQPVVHSDLVPPTNQPRDWFVLDVRTPGEFASGHIHDAVNVPLEELRDRMSELPTDRRIAVYCLVGQRGYMATRLLKHHGFDVSNLSGGFKSWQQHHVKETQS